MKKTKEEKTRLSILEFEFKEMKNDIAEIKEILKNISERILLHNGSLKEHKGKIDLHTRLIFLLLSINSVGIIGVLFFLLRR